MKVDHTENVLAAPVEMEGAHGCTVRWLVGKEDGAPNFAMREFEVAPGGHTPKHSHSYEHGIFVLEGEGVVLEGEHEHRLRPGDVVYVSPNDIHQFRNTGTRPFRFLCMVPHVPKDTPVTLVPECARTE